MIAPKRVASSSFFASSKAARPATYPPPWIEMIRGASSAKSAGMKVRPRAVTSTLLFASWGFARRASPPARIAGRSHVVCSGVSAMMGASSGRR